MLTFTPLPAAMLDELIAGARILEQDSFGPKVYQLRDGNMLKLFRRKRLLSSALLRPHGVSVPVRQLCKHSAFRPCNRSISTVWATRPDCRALSPVAR